MDNPKNLFITGNPGVGKTTLIKEATLPFWGRLGGFYTEELREGTSRSGFVLKTFPDADGRSAEGVLASKSLKTPTRLDKYGIDLSVLEGIGVRAIAAAARTPGAVVVVDEIGSMEVASPLFREKLLECLQSDRSVLATIRLHAQPFTNTVKKMAGTEVLTLTRANFADVKMKVRHWLEQRLPRK